MRVKMTTISWVMLFVLALLPGTSQAEPSRSSATKDDSQKPATPASKNSQGHAGNRPAPHLQEQEATAQLSQQVKALSEKSKGMHDTQQSILNSNKN